LISIPSNSDWTTTARWIFPAGSPSLERGTVTVSGDKIVSVDRHGIRTPDIDFGNAGILPGFVNAHTHLDLTGLRGQVAPSSDFISWLTDVIHHRRSLTPTQIAEDVAAGVAESITAGTTLVGDIAGSGLSWPMLVRADLRAVVFYELLGLPKTRAGQAWSTACEWLRCHALTATCRPGLSPHAPYSVRASLFRAAARLARAQRLPVTTHLAETPPEMELLEQHSGPFKQFLSDVGVWDPEGLVSGSKEVIELCAEAPNVLLAHGNYLKIDEIGRSNATVVYCPRTHAAFGHRPYPLRQFLDAGIRVAIGTDSLASNPDLSILEEARFVREQHPDIPGHTILQMATIWGAQALGWDTDTGSLSIGKSADLAIVAFPDRDDADPLDLMFRSRLPVVANIFRGKLAWKSPQARTRLPP
jgi:cytosine/adenosine deaminase-related metal-dependent hydrolase